MAFIACFTLLQGVLQKAHSANASYLFQQDKFYDVSYDTGDKSIQCGRKVDVLKVWMMWKAKGHFGFAAKIDNAFDMAGYVTCAFVSLYRNYVIAEKSVAKACVKLCFYRYYLVEMLCFP